MIYFILVLLYDKSKSLSRTFHSLYVLIYFPILPLLLQNSKPQLRIKSPSIFITITLFQVLFQVLVTKPSNGSFLLSSLSYSSFKLLTKLIQKGTNNISIAQGVWNCTLSRNSVFSQDLLQSTCPHIFTTTKPLLLHICFSHSNLLFSEPILLTCFHHHFFDRVFIYHELFLFHFHF